MAGERRNQTSPLKVHRKELDILYHLSPASQKSFNSSVAITAHGIISFLSQPPGIIWSAIFLSDCILSPAYSSISYYPYTCLSVPREKVSKAVQAHQIVCLWFRPRPHDNRYKEKGNEDKGNWVESIPEYAQ